MPFDIQELKSSLNRKGYQKGSHFAVNIAPPPIMGLPSIITDIPIRTNSVNLPGVNLGVDEIKHKGYGLGERRPLSVGYEDVTLTLIADASGEINNFLHDWMELIHPTDDERVGTDSVEFFEYPNEYYGGLEIYMYNMAGGKHTTFTLTNPFPVSIGGVQMGWENVDSLMMIPVSFAFRGFKRNSSYSGAVSYLENVNSQTVTNFFTA